MAASIFAVAVTLVALGSANNLVAIVMVLLWSAGLMTAVLGSLNMRYIEVERRLPYEVFAGTSATGSYLIRVRRWYGGFGLRVAERGGAAGAGVQFIRGRQSVRVLARWRFGERGLANLTGIRVMSRFPFGLAEWRVDSEDAAAVVVYPRPLPGKAAALLAGEREADTVDGVADRGQGDFVGLRPWRKGESMRDVHWPTSARVGEWMVVERVLTHELEVVSVSVDVNDLEPSIRRAAGAVLGAFDAGCAVTLNLETDVLGPGTGERWRARFLSALALHPLAGR